MVAKGRPVNSVISNNVMAYIQNDFSLYTQHTPNAALGKSLCSKPSGTFVPSGINILALSPAIPLKFSKKGVYYLVYETTLICIDAYILRKFFALFAGCGEQALCGGSKYTPEKLYRVFCQEFGGSSPGDGGNPCP
jgi:hypothetical protein